MLDKSSLHLLFKFNEEGRNGFKTMEEHIKVEITNHSVIWGHFSSSQTKKGLWQEKIDTMISQIKNGQEAFVFFYDKKNGLLYVGRYLTSWSANEFNRNHKKINLVPSYYHDCVGLPANGQMRSYCYVEVDKIKKLDINEIKKIYSPANGKSIDLNKGQNSVFYVNLDKSLLSNLTNAFIEFNENIEKEDMESIIVEDILSNTEDLDKEIKIYDAPKEKQITQTTERVKINRDSSLIANAIRYSNFACEFDEKHISFISKKTNKPFLEGHHLIPIAYQDKFDYSLDNESNIVALCPNCHRLLHHGIEEEKLIILQKLYNLRKERLKKTNIDVSFNILKKYYNI